MEKPFRPACRHCLTICAAAGRRESFTHSSWCGRETWRHSPVSLNWHQCTLLLPIFPLLCTDSTLCRAPTAGGQYHWVSILAPQSCQKLLSYITGMSPTQPIRLKAYTIRLGWLTVAGWQANVASSAYVCGTLIQGFIELVDPTYVPQLWHASLLLYGALALSIFTTTVIGTVLPMIESMMFVIYVLGFFGVLVPLVYLGPHGSAHDVFTMFLNEGGWSSQTLSFFVGISGNAFAFLGNWPHAIRFAGKADTWRQGPTQSTTYAVLFTILI